jgi:hypothetical protein
LRDLEHETLEVITLEQGSGIEDTFSQRSQIDGCERIGGPGVAADIEEWRVLFGVVEDVGQEPRNGVFVADGALVPVVGDALVAFGVDEVSVFVESDGEEGHEDFLGERTFGEFGGFVGHHAHGEVVPSRGDEDAGEGGGEEIWVGGDGVVEAADAEVEEGLVLRVGADAFDYGVVVLLELFEVEVVGLASEVEIRSGGGCVGFVFVVGARETLGLAGQTENVGEREGIVGGWATNGVGWVGIS